MTTTRLAVLLLSCALLTLPAAAATYFVAQQDAKASDDNAGAEASPFKTITRGTKALKSGDALYVKKGVYREEIVLPRKDWNWANVVRPAFAGGKSYAEMTTIQAFPGDEVVIKGSDVVTDWKPVEGLPADRAGKVFVRENWTVNSQQVICDEKVLQQIAGKMIDMLQSVWEGPKGKGLGDLEAGSFFYDIAGKKLYVWLPDGSDPNKHAMEVSTRSFLLELDSDFVRVSGLKMRHATISSCVNWSSAGLGGANNIVENCEITDTDFGGLSVGGQCNTIINCKMNHHGDNGLGASGWGHRFVNCETSYNNYRHFQMGWHAGGVKIIPYAHDILMTGHLAAYNEGDGIWFDSGNFNVTVQNSVSHHNKGAGIFYEISERGTFRNNVCYENKSRGLYLSNSSDCQVLHNVFYRNGMSGVASIGVKRSYPAFGEGPDTRLPARNNIVIGNIFYDNCNPELCPKEPDGRDKPWDTRPELIMPDEWETNTGNFSDYNIFYRSPSRVMPFWKGWHMPGQIYDDLAAWQAKTGNDKHSIIAQPLFVDAAKYDFRPAKGSPAIGFVQPRMGSVYQGDGKLRPTLDGDKKDARFTAGPMEFEPEKK